MMIGQISHVFPDAVVRERLGGFNDIPPNTERAQKQELWRIIDLGYWRLERRQMRINRFAWQTRKDIKLVDPGDLGDKMLDAHLFIRRDLSGIILVLDHGHARSWAKDAMWGYYQRHTFKFAVCRHQTITSATKNAYSTYFRSTCAECGFWTEVDSSD